MVSTSVGYTGGSLAEPTYKQVCTDRTGHAEVVELSFDPSLTSYEALLRFFFSMHNPTTRYRSGPDIGTQYRSAIFFHTPEQQATAAAVMAELNQTTFKGGIVTELNAATRFWPAEEYHQDYYKGTGIVLTRRGPKVQSNAYKFYREACGRDARVKAVWGDQAFSH